MLYSNSPVKRTSPISSKICRTSTLPVPFSVLNPAMAIGGHMLWLWFTNIGSIPKRLPIYFLYDHKLLAKLSICGWKVLSVYLKSAVPYDGAVPGASIAVQTSGDFQNFNPHLHAIVSDGCFIDDDSFRMAPAFMLEDLEEAFQYEVLKMLKKEGKNKWCCDRKHAFLASYWFPCIYWWPDLSRWQNWSWQSGQLHSPSLLALKLHFVPESVWIWPFDLPKISGAYENYQFYWKNRNYRNNFTTPWALGYTQSWPTTAWSRLYISELIYDDSDSQVPAFDYWSWFFLKLNCGITGELCPKSSEIW